jgi:hypothetical protein
MLRSARPVVTIGLVVAAGAMAWLTHLGPHTGYADGVLGPLILAGFGLGMVIAPAINTGTYGVAPQDAGVASATVTVSQQLGASIGTSLLNTIFATAVASYLVTHESSTRFITRAALNNAALAHGYDTAFWWTCAITAGGAAIAALLLRPGPLAGPAKAISETSLQPSAELNPYSAPDRSGHEQRGSRRPKEGPPA